MIPDIPDLDDTIKTAYKDKKLIIFFGAGLSSLLGCKRWKAMANSLIEECYNKGKFDFWVYQSLKRNYSPRKLITMAKDKLDQNDYKAAVEETLSNSNIPKGYEKYSDIYTKLKRLEKNALFITTNIDKHFSGLFDEQNVFHEIDSFSTQNISPGKVFHLHGMINKEVVLTIDEYVERYNQSKIQQFLQAIFHDDAYLKIFMGYGLDELEIIDYIVTKAENNDSKEKQKMKMGRLKIILPFFNAEEIMLQYEKKYFERLKIDVIPYAIDIKGYTQIYDVLDSWVRQLIDENEDFYSNIKLIDEVL